MTLQQLKYAVEIARYGSITKAAGHLFISQPSLSNAIMELENEIGITNLIGLIEALKFLLMVLNF